MFERVIRTIAVCTTPCVVVACSDTRALASSSPVLAVSEFADLFEEVNIILLEQPAGYPLVNIAGLDVDGLGRMVIADAGESRLAMFSPDGKLLLSIGQRGDGPGEFRMPRAPQFDEHGRIHVVDAIHGRISVFDSTGVLVQELSTPGGFVVQDMRVAAEGYLLAGHPPSSQHEDVIVALDPQGVMLWQALPLAERHPAGTPPEQRWRTLRTHALTVAGDSVFLTQALFDSLWVLDRRTGERIASHSITVDGYERPSMPVPPPAGAEEIANWAREQMRATTIVGDATLLIVPFAKGAYWRDTEPSLAAVRNEEGTWLGARDVPVVMRVRDGMLYALARPNLYDFEVRTYRLQLSTQ